MYKSCSSYSLIFSFTLKALPCLLIQSGRRQEGLLAAARHFWVITAVFLQSVRNISLPIYVMVEQIFFTCSKNSLSKPNASAQWRPLMQTTWKWHWGARLSKPQTLFLLQRQWHTVAYTRNWKKLKPFIWSSQALWGTWFLFPATCLQYFSTSSVGRLST